MAENDITFRVIIDGKDAAVTLGQIQGQLTETSHQAEAASGGLGALGRSLIGLTAGLVSARAALGFLSEGLRDAGNRERDIAQLGRALQNAGNFTATAVQGLVGYANALQSTTGKSADAIIAGEKLIASYGLTAALMRQVTTDAVDLSVATGVDLTSAMQALGLAASGEASHLGELGLVLDEARIKTDGYRVVHEAVLRQAGGQAATNLETYAGKVEAAANAWGDLRSAIADTSLVGRGIDAATQSLTILTEAITRARDAARGAAGDRDEPAIRARLGALNQQIDNPGFASSFLSEAQQKQRRAGLIAERDALRASLAALTDLAAEQERSNATEAAAKNLVDQRAAAEIARANALKKTSDALALVEHAARKQVQPVAELFAEWDRIEAEYKSIGQTVPEVVSQAFGESIIHAADAATESLDHTADALDRIRDELATIEKSARRQVEPVAALFEEWDALEKKYRQLGQTVPEVVQKMFAAQLTAASAPAAAPTAAPADNQSAFDRMVAAFGGRGNVAQYAQVALTAPGLQGGSAFGDIARLIPAAMVNPALAAAQFAVTPQQSDTMERLRRLAVNISPLALTWRALGLGQQVNDFFGFADPHAERSLRADRSLPAYSLLRDLGVADLPSPTGVIGFGAGQTDQRAALRALMGATRFGTEIIGRSLPGAAGTRVGEVAGALGISQDTLLGHVHFRDAVSDLTTTLDDLSTAFGSSSDTAEEWNQRVAQAAQDFADATVTAAQTIADQAMTSVSTIRALGQQAFGVESSTNALLAGIYFGTDPTLAGEFIRKNFAMAQRQAETQPGIFSGQQLQGAAVGLYNFAQQTLFGDELVAAQRDAQAAIELGRDLQLAAISDQLDVARDQLEALLGIRGSIDLLVAQLGITKATAQELLPPRLVHTSSVSGGVLA